MIHFFSRLFESHLNLLSTLYLNFRVFRLIDAIKFPVYVYGRCCLEGLHKGCIQLSEVKPHVLRIGGGKSTYLYGRSKLYKSYFSFSGTWFVGDNVIIDQGCVISVCDGARLNFGNNIYINRKTLIHVKEHVSIGDNTWMGWDCQILDSIFHFTEHEGIIKRRNGPVSIGQGVWLSNRVTVLQGSFLPDYSIVAVNSVVNKDFRDFGQGCLIGGVPAKIVARDYKRIFCDENVIDRRFGEDKDYIVSNEL